jgi:hypothetical protein
MGQLLTVKKRLLGLGLILLVGAAVWLAWTPFWTWYFLRGLAAADVEAREKWIKRVARLDTAAVPGLLACLARDDAQACANAGAALAYLAHAWGPDDPRAHSLAEALRDRFSLLGVPGQEAVLDWQIAVLGEAKARLPGPLEQVARDLLAAAGRRHESAILSRALALADVVADRLEAGPCLASCRQLAQQALCDPAPEARTRAARLTQHGPFRKDLALLRQVLPLLRDPDAGVRRAAVLAVGPAKEVISEEDLLPLLHDSSPEVRRECETTLRSRGLNDEHLLLGLLISDRQPAARLQVLHYVDSTDVDPGVWLRRLCRDPAPAVRAAAVRAIAQGEIDLGDQVRQMAQGDPSPTVRQLAAHYLRPR